MLKTTTRGPIFWVECPDFKLIINVIFWKTATFWVESFFGMKDMRGFTIPVCNLPMFICVSMVEYLCFIYDNGSSNRQVLIKAMPWMRKKGLKREKE